MDLTANGVLSLIHEASSLPPKYAATSNGVLLIGEGQVGVHGRRLSRDRA